MARLATEVSTSKSKPRTSWTDFLSQSPLAGSRVKVPRRAETAPTSNEIEAANRAEATALLIRAGYRVYRPEADCYGEDLVLRFPNRELHAVQLKSSPIVDWRRYGGRALWLLFPDPLGSKISQRDWFLLPHDALFDWMKSKHGHVQGWQDAWRTPYITKQLKAFLAEFLVRGEPDIDKR